MTEELLNALKLIKAECEKHLLSFSHKCDECPLQTAEADCGVMQLEPSSWKLEKREVYF